MAINEFSSFLDASWEQDDVLSVPDCPFQHLLGGVEASGAEAEFPHARDHESGTEGSPPDSK